ncbi:hypothetical protein PIB30_067706 [Stylosanthes scabra]|uniref:Secreted protein n=1 Tax=Stylosanthes scabra TaxID=79078 RepID=A0ABU6QN74_9FABA|nr:hypothetical protein [Stylosanthes scabra]
MALPTLENCTVLCAVGVRRSCIYSAARGSLLLVEGSVRSHKSRDSSLDSSLGSSSSAFSLLGGSSGTSSISISSVVEALILFSGSSSLLSTIKTFPFGVSLDGVVLSANQRANLP